MGMIVHPAARVVPFGRQRLEGVVLSLVQTTDLPQERPTFLSRWKTTRPSCRPWWTLPGRSPASRIVPWRWRCA